MAIKFLFAVRDSKAMTFGSPFLDVANGRAVRGFSDAVNDSQNNELYKHPEDFDLYVLGQFDDSTGLFDTSDPIRIAVGKDLKV